MKGARPMTAWGTPPHQTGQAYFMHPAFGVPFFGLLHEVSRLVCIGKLIKLGQTRRKSN